MTWLVEGEVLHRDSLGNEQTIVPGQRNLTTAGYEIAHSEQSAPDHSPGMHGLQLSVALPDDARHGPARFEHHAALPSLFTDGATDTVAGEQDGIAGGAFVVGESGVHGDGRGHRFTLPS